VDTSTEAGGGPLKVKPEGFSPGSAAARGMKDLWSQPFLAGFQAVSESPFDPPKMV